MTVSGRRMQAILYRIVQEVLDNIIKTCKCKRATYILPLKISNITNEDNGNGFDL
jgi:glucose-6-phosphate-specific signal transduction histidine kinase